MFQEKKSNFYLQNVGVNKKQLINIVINVVSGKFHGNNENLKS